VKRSYVRDGDFYFYENDPFLSNKQRSKITSTRFADVIKRNTSLKNITNIFFIDNCLLNKDQNVESNSTQSNLRVTAFPNPYENVVNLNFPEIKENVKIEIYTLSGKKIKSFYFNKKSTIQLNISDLNQKIHIAKITSDNLEKTISLIKN